MSYFKEKDMGYWVQKIVKMLGIAFSLHLLLEISSCQKNTKFHLPYYNDPTFSPLFIDSKIAKLKISHQISNFQLVNQDSLPINQNIISDKIHIANFIFTSCGSICPTMTKNLKIFSDKTVGWNDVAILSFSVTPWIDTPSTLKKYMFINNIRDNRWHFITGEKNKIYDLARKSYFAEEEIGFTKDNSEFLHTEHILLVDKHKKIRGIYNGTLELDILQLIEDVKILREEE